MEQVVLQQPITGFHVMIFIASESMCSSIVLVIKVSLNFFFMFLIILGMINDMTRCDFQGTVFSIST